MNNPTAGISTRYHFILLFRSRIISPIYFPNSYNVESIISLPDNKVGEHIFLLEEQLAFTSNWQVKVKKGIDVRVPDNEGMEDVIMCPQYLHSFWIKVNVTMWECQWYPVIDQNRPFDGGLSLAQIPPICLDISYTLHTSKVIWLHPRIPNGYRGKGSTTSTSAKESSYYGRDSTSTGTQLMSVKSPEKDVSLLFFSWKETLQTT